MVSFWRAVMATTSFTTRMDSDLKARLERIAHYEERSASFVANQAIKALVEDREYSHRLIELGLREIEAGRIIPENEMDAWVDDWSEGNERPFPVATKKTAR